MSEFMASRQAPAREKQTKKKATIKKEVKMNKVVSGILMLALVLATVASLSARPNETAPSYQVSSGELSYVIGGSLIGCLVGIAGEWAL